MADYKDIKGGTIQNFAGDPPAPINGQVWYDSAAVAFQFRTVSPVGAWATGGTINTARNSLAGAGTQTAALAIAGQPGKDEVESYDGTSWTEIADVNTQRQDLGGCGTQTAALIFGGEPVKANVEKWDGSSWTEEGDLNTARYGLGDNSIGTNTAALCAGGFSPPVTGIAELWNGTSWTEVGDLNTGRARLGTFGTSTAAIAVAGAPSPAGGDETESWNGTSWTELGDLATARREPSPGVFSANTASIVFNGYGPDYTNATEEWNDPVYTIKTVTVS